MIVAITTKAPAVKANKLRTAAIALRAGLERTERTARERDLLGK